MGNISKKRTHVFSFFGKPYSTQTPKIVNAQNMPMSRIRTRHTKRELCSKAKIIDEGTCCFPFEREASHVAVFIACFCKLKTGILMHFKDFFSWKLFICLC